MTDDTQTIDLPLALRTRNALIKAGLTTWGQVKARPLEEVAGLGARGIDAIQALWTSELGDQAVIDAWAGKIKVGPEQEVATPEESIARANGSRHTVASMIDHAMRGGLERMTEMERSLERANRAPAEGRLALEELNRRNEAFRAQGGWVETTVGSGLLALQLEADIQARISALIPTIKALPHVKELGVVVDEKVVGRMALIRGLDALEKTNGQTPTPAAKTVDPQSDEPVVPVQDGERYATPDGWNKVSPTEAVPASQVDVHSYYQAYGWERYWGKVDSTTFYFYWCPEKLNQDVAPFPGNDKGGRKIAIQQTPWGPGHILPAGWNT
jgi:hypothetical protein